MINRSYTLMILAQNASKARTLVIPAWMVRVALVLIPLVLVIFFTVLLDYRFISNEIFENRELQSENRRLRQDVQIYKNRLETLEANVSRIENFSLRLKTITNLMNPDELSQQLERDPPNSLDVFKSQKTEIASSDRTWDQSFFELQNRSEQLEQGLNDLFELLSDQRSFLKALPTKSPASGNFTSGFGIRVSPFGEGEKMHEGLDIANVVGTPIKATAQGVVTFAGRKSGYGQIVIMDHGYGLETWYGHTSRVLVKQGQRVKRGQPIALIGNSGRSTGAHLHYEVRVRGIPVDPWNYILEN